MLPNREDFEVNYNDENNIDSNEWKILFKRAIKNKNKMQNFIISDYFKFLNISEDLKNSELLIFRSLKEFLTLPILRKENFVIQNEINTTHQIYNYDIIKEEENIFRYYDNIFRYDNKFKFISVQKKDLLFSNLLRNSKQFFFFFNYHENVENKMILGKLRWFCCDESIIFSESNEFEENPIITVLKLIFAKIILFCRISYMYIQKFAAEPENFSQNYLFINEYIKRYKTFFESAININGELENLNVFVNYLYETTFQHYPSTPKFSIYRLMNVVWNKEVLLPLLNSNNESLNLYRKIKIIYGEFLMAELKKEINQEITSTTVYNNLDIIKYFIEQTSSSILDYECNEYSVFYLNHSGMKISNYYRRLEIELTETFEEVLKKFITDNSQSNYTLLNLNIYNRVGFINRTQFQLMKSFSKVILDSLTNDLNILFYEFLINNNLFENDADFYSSLNSEWEINRLPSEIIDIKNKLIQIAFNFSRNFKLSNNAASFFLTEIKKNPGRFHLSAFKILKSIEETILNYNEIYNKFEKINRKVIKVVESSIPCNYFNNSFLHYNAIEFEMIEENFIEERKIEIELFEKVLYLENRAARVSSNSNSDPEYSKNGNSLKVYLNSDENQSMASTLDLNNDYEIEMITSII